MRLPLLLASALFSVLSLFAGPKIEIVGGNTQDWGDVKPSNDPLTHTVTLKNIGDEPLIISGVKPSCGCTTAPIDKDNLKPGETASIDVSFKAGKSTGSKTKTIRITSNDPTNPTVIYRLKANVVKDLMVGPGPYMNFSNLEVGKKAETEVFIQNNGKKTVTLSNFTTFPESMKINLTKPVTLAPGEKVDVKAWYTPDKAGYTTVRIEMNTSHPDDPQLVITGYGTAKESPIFQSGSK